MIGPLLLHNPLDGLPQDAAALTLETARIGAVVASAPILWNIAPARARAAFVLCLAFVAHGMAPRGGPRLDSLERIAIAVPSEMLIGLAMGLVVRLSIGVIEMSGEAMSMSMGLSAANMFDPHSQAMESGLTRVLRLLTVLVALLLGVHRMLIGSLLASFQVIPVGSAVHAGLAMPLLSKLASLAIISGFRLALPVVSALLLTQMALAFVSRAAPAMQIFSIGFAITLATGTSVLLIALPELATEISGELGQVQSRIDAVLSAMSPG